MLIDMPKFNLTTAPHRKFRLSYTSQYKKISIQKKYKSCPQFSVATMPCCPLLYPQKHPYQYN